MAPYAPAREASQAGGQTSLPAPLDRYVRTMVRLTPGEMKTLLGSQPVVRLLDTDADHEVAVFSAAWINAPAQSYVDAVNDIESFERGGGFRITKRISDPPRIEDFAQLTLPESDVADLRSCRVGECEVKLSQSALEELRAGIDWSKPTAHADVQAAMRRRAYEFVSGYLKGGNDRLGVYRDARRPTFVAAEFTSMIDRLPELVDHLPALRRYLLEYPKAVLPGATSFLYWQEVEFGLKPTIRINHVVLQRADNRIVVATKMLYASHYFWTALDLRVLVPDARRGPGFWLVTVGRSRSDGLTGFLGRFVRNRVRREAREGAMRAVMRTKTALEKRALAQ